MLCINCPHAVRDPAKFTNVNVRAYNNQSYSHNAYKRHIYCNSVGQTVNCNLLLYILSKFVQINSLSLALLFSTIYRIFNFFEKKEALYLNLTFICSGCTGPLRAQPHVLTKYTGQIKISNLQTDRQTFPLRLHLRGFPVIIFVRQLHQCIIQQESNWEMFVSNQNTYTFPWVFNTITCSYFHRHSIFSSSVDFLSLAEFRVFSHVLSSKLMPKKYGVLHRQQKPLGKFHFDS